MSNQSNQNPLADLPVSPMSCTRCGECGHAAPGHSTACSKYDHRVSTVAPAATLGTQTGSLVTGSKMPAPEVGMGATRLCWSDRHAATIVEVSKSGKALAIVQDEATRVDKNGMSESQEYTFAHGTVKTARGFARATPSRASAWRSEAAASITISASNPSCLPYSPSKRRRRIAAIRRPPRAPARALPGKLGLAVMVPGLTATRSAADKTGIYDKMLVDQITRNR